MEVGTLTLGIDVRDVGSLEIGPESLHSGHETPQTLVGWARIALAESIVARQQHLDEDR